MHRSDAVGGVRQDGIRHCATDGGPTPGRHRRRAGKDAGEDTGTKEREHFRSEFRYGAFTRVLPLPPGASDTDVTATYTDGILEVRVPTRTEADRSKKVTVTRG